MGKITIPFVRDGALKHLTVAEVKKSYESSRDQLLAGILHGVKIGEGQSLGKLNALIEEERARVAQLKQSETDPISGIYYFDADREQKLKYTVGVLHGLQAVRASLKS